MAREVRGARGRRKSVLLGLVRLGLREPQWRTCILIAAAVAGLVGLSAAAEAKECEKPCVNGWCDPASGSCVCEPGWVEEQCQHCGGRFRLTGPSGYLTDGPGNYKHKTKCTWLIEGQVCEGHMNVNENEPKGNYAVTERKCPALPEKPCDYDS